MVFTECDWLADDLHERASSSHLSQARLGLQGRRIEAFDQPCPIWVFMHFECILCIFRQISGAVCKSLQLEVLDFNRTMACGVC